jgi:hypothetical protein
MGIATGRLEWSVHHPGQCTEHAYTAERSLFRFPPSPHSSEAHEDVHSEAQGHDIGEFAKHICALLNPDSVPSIADKADYILKVYRHLL